MKQSKKLLKSSLLKDFPNLVHGFTTRKAGDFRYGNLDRLAKIFKINPKDIITMSQVHGNAVGLLGSGPKGLPRGGRHVDGMITNLNNKFLVVKVADCVPILFYDPVKEIVAVCHAGWKGTLEKIGGKIINKMQKKGSEPKNIIAVLGPHIEACCYKVQASRAQMFKEKISSPHSVITLENQDYLSLGVANYELLLASGIHKENIETRPFCTSCQNSLFFSYRKEGPTHGEQVGLIGLKS